MKSAPFKFIDLFAGLGGFHLALSRLGGQCVFAAEWQEHLRDLYKVNFGIRPEGDITLISPNDVPSHDVLTAGFPCQPFSKAGDQLGFECTKQGDLFFNVAAILKQKKPRFFILENVFSPESVGCSFFATDTQSSVAGSGEKRDYVAAVAAEVKKRLGRDAIFYDKDFTAHRSWLSTKSGDNALCSANSARMAKFAAISAAVAARTIAADHSSRV